jgi:hypothetical protein
MTIGLKTEGLQNIFKEALPYQTLPTSLSLFSHLFDCQSKWAQSLAELELRIRAIVVALLATIDANNVEIDRQLKAKGIKI